jgi:hypothetical protein
MGGEEDGLQKFELEAGPVGIEGDLMADDARDGYFGVRVIIGVCKR